MYILSSYDESHFSMQFISVFLFLYYTPIKTHMKIAKITTKEITLLMVTLSVLQFKCTLFEKTQTEDRNFLNRLKNNTKSPIISKFIKIAINCCNDTSCCFVVEVVFTS